MIQIQAIEALDQTDDEASSDGEVDPPHRIYRSPHEQFCIATMSKEAKELLKLFEKARCPVDLCKIIDDNESLAIVVTVSE
jgi:selenophosphate synthetase-related protein